MIPHTHLSSRIQDTPCTYAIQIYITIIIIINSEQKCMWNQTKPNEKHMNSAASSDCCLFYMRIQTLIFRNESIDLSTNESKRTERRKTRMEYEMQYKKGRSVTNNILSYWPARRVMIKFSTGVQPTNEQTKKKRHEWQTSIFDCL